VPARAEEPWIPGVGVFFGVAFGNKIGFESGIEAFATHRFQPEDICLLAPRPGAGIGPMAQLALTNFGEPRVTAGLYGGGDIAAGGPTFRGELGATYRFGARPGFGIHTGATLNVDLSTTSVRAQWLLENYAATVGARYTFRDSAKPAFTYGAEANCVGGRPLRTSTGVARIDAPSISGHASSRTDINDEAFAAGLEWQRAAQHECASIPAFLQLAAELLAHDAPDALVDAALTAAEDELMHTRISADLASHYLGARVHPSLPDVPPRAPLAGQAGLMRLATESWLDGCLTEGVAAERALSALQIATEPLARAAQRTIAHDEARHAELGWSILQWATQLGDNGVRDAVRTLRNVEMAAGAETSIGTEPFGCLGAKGIDEVTERLVAHSRRRLDALF